MLTFNCPNCGSDERLWQKLVELNKLRPEEHGKALILSSYQTGSIGGNDRIGFRIFVDACAKCGTVYAFEVDTGSEVFEMLLKEDKASG